MSKNKLSDKYLSTILKEKRITEKSQRLIGLSNKHTFIVDRAANKHSIKEAIERVFEVEVSKVNVMNCLGRKKRLMKSKPGKEQDYKKAIVTLKSGTIEITGGNYDQ